MRATQPWTVKKTWSGVRMLWTVISSEFYLYLPFQLYTFKYVEYDNLNFDKEIFMISTFFQAKTQCFVSHWPNNGHPRSALQLQPQQLWNNPSISLRQTNFTFHMCALRFTFFLLRSWILTLSPPAIWRAEFWSQGKYKEHLFRKRMVRSCLYS